MVKLIRADIIRLFRTVSFWICLIGMLATMLVNFWVDHRTAMIASAGYGGRMFACAAYVMFFASIFISLFIGTDYSDGTVRNKLSAGHSRWSVYLSNFIVCSVGAVIYSVMFFAAQAAAGIAVGWSAGMEPGEIVIKIAVTLLAVIAECSLLTLIGMLITVKSSSAVCSIMITVSLTAVVSFLLNAVIDFGSPAREIFTVVCGVLPCGQAIQLAFTEISPPAVLLMYSVIFILAATLIGGVLFKQKDLK